MLTTLLAVHRWVIMQVQLDYVSKNSYYGWKMRFRVRSRFSVRIYLNQTEPQKRFGVRPRAWTGPWVWFGVRKKWPPNQTKPDPSIPNQKAVPSIHHEHIRWVSSQIIWIICTDNLTWTWPNQDCSLCNFEHWPALTSTLYVHNSCLSPPTHGHSLALPPLGVFMAPTMLSGPLTTKVVGSWCILLEALAGPSYLICAFTHFSNSQPASES